MTEPEDIVRHAKDLAKLLMGMPLGQRITVLGSIEKKDKALHLLIVSTLKSYRDF
jgi:hypothetical protein